MGNVENVGYDKFPRQGSFLHSRVNVCFNYDTSKKLQGTVVRDDVDEPYNTIIKLDDGRYVLSIECQYNVIDKPINLNID